jgi:UDP:flavonoid glycosyltransferase YjiC (YdhE family)
MVVGRRSVLVVTWGGGGSVPPLLATAQVLAARGFGVEVLTSTATRAQAGRHGFATHAYPRAPEPDMSVPFEVQAGQLLADAAGIVVARDVLAVALDLSPDLLVVDCLLAAGLAAGEAAGVPTASLVHFPYAAARAAMASGAGAGPIDGATLAATRRALGLPATAGGVAAWESPDLLLVTVPRWFDAPGRLPGHVVHAGPLGVRGARTRPTNGGRVLAAFSTTVMEGQRQLVERVCAALERAGLEAVLTLGPALDRSVTMGGAGVKAVQWADHDELARRCDLVVTHGGMGTTLRALAHGRPLLMLPLGRDQQFNAGRVEALGAGLRLAPDASVDAIATAMTRLLGESAFARAAHRAAASIAAARPDEVAAGALTRLAAS